MPGRAQGVPGRAQGAPDRAQGAPTPPASQSAPTEFPASAAHKLDGLIEAAINQGQCPGAVLLVGSGSLIVYEKAYGHRSVQPRLAPMTTDTVFDLASLTKPLATAPSILLLQQRGKLNVSDPVAKYLPAFGTGGKEAITVADLLLHVGGLPDDNDLVEYRDGPSAAMQKIYARRLPVAPRQRFVYSDVGFIVLGELVRQVDGRRLDRFASEEIFRPLKMTDTQFCPAEAIRSRCAPTEQRDGRWLVGEVHDPRSAALGGVAGHAGLFSTAEDLSKFCRLIAGDPAMAAASPLTPQTLQEMILPRPVPGGLRTYGFDVDTPYSAPRGDLFPRGQSLGHTGFTGVAFWIDPRRHAYYILLTSSLHPSGKGNVKQLRRDVANAVAEALER